MLVQGGLITGAVVAAATVHMCMLPLASFLGTSGVMGKGGGPGMVQIRWWWHEGCAFTNVKQGRRLGAETPKPSHCGSVPSLLCQTAMVGGGVSYLVWQWSRTLCSQTQAGGRG